jgi:hypothetical protein
MMEPGSRKDAAFRCLVGNRGLRFGRLVAAAAFAVVVLGAATVEAAHPIKHRIYKGKVTLPSGVSRQPTVVLNVSSSGKSLQYGGPHEGCNGTFNVSNDTRGYIPKVKISRSGAFAAKRKYTMTSHGSNYTYYFHWDIKLSGKFVTRRKAKGKLTYEMTETDNRSQPPGRVLHCGRQTVNYTARLKK